MAREQDMEALESIWLGGRKKGKISAITYVRKFLGLQIIFIPVSQVLLFFVGKDKCWFNPFIKGAVDSIHYNGAEIIAYDDGRWGKSKQEYLTLLKESGYPYINKIVLPEEFGQKKCNIKFYANMVKKYNSEQKKYGMIGQYVNGFALWKHIDYLNYSSPDIYPKRYIYDSKNEAQKVFEFFVNSQLFSGYRMETKGYHFGYCFGGIFYDTWAKKIRQKAKGKTVCFLWNARHLKEVYSMLYPEDTVKMLYFDLDTIGMEAIKEYVKEAACGQKIFIVNGSFRNQSVLALGYEGMDVNDLFSKAILKKYHREINHMLSDLTSKRLHIKQMNHSVAEWEEIPVEEDKPKREQALLGVYGFVREFQVFLEEHKDIAGNIADKDGEFLAKTIAYAYDEKRQKKIHYSRRQWLMESKVPRKCLKKMRSIYRKVKGK